jgi:hypothetical protein
MAVKSSMVMNPVRVQDGLKEIPGSAFTSGRFDFPDISPYS